VDADNSAAKSTQVFGVSSVISSANFSNSLSAESGLQLITKKEDKEERKKKRTRSIVSLSQLAGEDIALSSWD